MCTRPTRSNRLASILALAAAVGVACSKDVSSPLPSTALMPLWVGSHWSYEWYDSVEFGTGFTPGVVGTTGTEVTVTRDTLIGGTTWAIVDGGSDLLDYGTGPKVLGNQQDGLYEYDASPGFGLPSLTLPLFPYPTHAGAPFGRHGEGRVSTADTLITVPAGTFHCIRYDLTSAWGDSTSDDTFFISPQTGVIMRVMPRSEALDANGNVVGAARLEFRLRSVSIGGG